MKTILKKIFIEHWPRKLIALILAIIIWILVNHSITTTKTFLNIPIKVINIPEGKTIEGLQKNNFLNQRINLTLTGNKNVLENINNSDLEILLDAKNKKKHWVIDIKPSNIICLNPDIDIQKNISKITHSHLILNITSLTTQRIPILITEPIGDPPKGYAYLNIWPYQLYITVTGPSGYVQQLQSKGLKLTYNLNDISEEDLKNAQKNSRQTDIVNFFLPESWKKISLPMIYENSITIDDPQANALKIEFSKKEIFPINREIPLSIFYPSRTIDNLNPTTHNLELTDFIKKKNGIYVMSQPLYAWGVSRLFLDVVEDMMQIVIVATEQNCKESPHWYVEFIYRNELEDLYVAKSLLNISDSETQMHPQQREEFLRNRFRNYMNKFRIYTIDNKKLLLDIHIDDNKVKIIPK